MNESVTTIGGRIAEARSKASMTQRDLAQISGLSQTTISRIESGERTPSAGDLALLADACGVLVADLTDTNTIRQRVRCAGRTDDAAAIALVDYLVYAFSCMQRLDAMHVPDAA